MRTRRISRFILCWEEVHSLITEAENSLLCRFSKNIWFHGRLSGAQSVIPAWTSLTSGNSAPLTGCFAVAEMIGFLHIKHHCLIVLMSVSLS